MTSRRILRRLLTILGVAIYLLVAANLAPQLELDPTAAPSP